MADLHAGLDAGAAGPEEALGRGRLDPVQQTRLADASAIELGFPHDALHRLGLAR